MGSCRDMDVTQPDIELQGIGNTNDFKAQILAPVRTRLARGNSLFSEVYHRAAQTLIFKNKC
jgi:hypothetical protein